ncbi:hypothetical protein C8Q78DRAFT_490561 [Trametes maxima]|nr:hypothetical protein C8Q78DRAFT_490561 [Trametes maxima]
MAVFTNCRTKQRGLSMMATGLMIVSGMDAHLPLLLDFLDPPSFAPGDPCHPSDGCASSGEFVGSTLLLFVVTMPTGPDRVLL